MEGGSSPPERRLEEEVRNERTAKVQALVAGILHDQKAGGPTLADELIANAALLRELRNYGVHPVKVRDDLERYFDEEECGLLLLRTHNYLVGLSHVLNFESVPPGGLGPDLRRLVRLRQRLRLRLKR